MRAIDGHVGANPETELAVAAYGEAAFFEIPAPLDFLPPYDRGHHPVFYGMFEGNDPNKRLLAIANYNNDISEYWEYSDTGFAPVSETNEAYKLGVNYLVYGLTH